MAGLTDYFNKKQPGLSRSSEWRLNPYNNGYDYYDETNNTNYPVSDGITAQRTAQAKAALAAAGGMSGSQYGVREQKLINQALQGMAAAGGMSGSQYGQVTGTGTGQGTMREQQLINQALQRMAEQGGMSGSQYGKSGAGTGTGPGTGTEQGTGTGEGTTTGDTIYDKQMTLAERLAAEQRRLAEQTAAYKRQSLSDELDAQRRQYAQQLASMNEQMYGQGNRLLEGLSNRGLATSGLLQLGDVQSQMVKGQGLSELAYQDRQTRETLGQGQRQVENDLFSALRQSELDKSSNMLSAEQEKANRAERMQSELLQATLALYELAGSEGVTQETINSAREAYQNYFGQIAPELTLGGGEGGGLPQPQASPTSQLDALGEYGTTIFNDRLNLWNVAGTALGGAAAGAGAGALIGGAGGTVVPGAGNIVGGAGGAVVGGIGGLIGGTVSGIGAEANKYRYKLPGGNVQEYATPEDFIGELNNYYSKMPGNENIEIKANKSGDIRFYVKGTKTAYKTYNAAYNAYTARG